MAKKTGVELEFSIIDSEFKQAIKEMNSAISSMKKELQLENEVLKSSSVTIEDYKNKIDLLKQQQEISNNKVRETAAAYEEAKAMFGETSKEASKYKDALIMAQTEQQKISNEIDKTTVALNEHEQALSENKSKSNELNSTYKNLISTIQSQKNDLDELKQQYVNTVLEQGKSSSQARDLKDKIILLNNEINNNETRLNNAEKGLKDFESAEDSAGKASITFGNLIKANIISDAIKKGFSELVNLAKQLGQTMLDAGMQSLNGFSDYEQLVGGVDTLFKSSSRKVQEYANNAYKTSGLSANQYMETVTSFSASLLQSLNNDTAKAAQIADMAIIDMSDNANKMGTDMSMIQNAYQGFAKQNYTMLDNLKLGYGGTKTEMERLLADAQKLTGIKYDISSLSDVYSAIHVIQDQIGITGTTAKEASSTIQGSTTSMKTAWQNLLTGMADSNANHEQLVQNFVDSIIGENGEGGFLGNIIPRIKIMINGAKEVFSELWEKLPEIAEEIPELKPLIDSLQWIKDNGPLIASIITGITAAITAFKIASTVTQIISGFQTFFTVIKSGQGIMAALNLVMSANPIVLIVAAIAGLVLAFTTLWNTSDEFRNFWIDLWDGIKNTVSGAIDWIKGFFSGIIDFITENWQGLLLLIVNPFVGGFKLLYDNCEGFRNFVNNFIQNVISFFQQIPTKISEFVQNTITFFQELPEKIGYFIGQMIGHILKFGIDAYNWVVTEVPKIINGIITFFQELPGKIWNFLVDIINKAGQWGSSMISKAKETAKNFIDNVINFFKQLPQKMWSFLTDTISKVANWGKNLVSKGKEAASNLFNAIVNKIKSLPSEMLNIGKNLVQGIWNGISNAKDWVINKIKDFGDSIIDGIKDVLGIHSPSKVMENQVGNNLALGIGVGFTNEMKYVAKQMQDAIPTNFDLETNINNATASTNYNRDISSTSDYNPGEIVPIYITIEEFNNNREQDIEGLSEELEFYRKKYNYGRGNA